MARDNKDSRGEQLQQFSTIRKRKTTRSITDAAGYWRISAPVATTDRLGSRDNPTRMNGDMNLSPVPPCHPQLTSNIADELNTPEYTIGEYYTQSNKSLNNVN